MLELQVDSNELSSDLRIYVAVSLFLRNRYRYAPALLRNLRSIWGMKEGGYCSVNLNDFYELIIASGISNLLMALRA